MLSAIQEVARADGLRIAASPLAIEHVGYDGDQQAKHHRNLPLLRARLAQDPDHVFSWHHLGRTLAALGDPEGAAEAWRCGIDVFRRLAAIDPETLSDDAVACDMRIFGVWALDALGLCCFRPGPFAKSAGYYTQAEALADDGAHYAVKRRLAEAQARRDTE